MFFLIINNKTRTLEEVKRLLKGHSFDVVNFNSDINNLDKYQGVILTGSHMFFADKDEQKFLKEMDIIRNSNLPIFGICFGFQLIAHSFGADLNDLGRSEKGILEIKKARKDEIFEGVNDFEVFENHRRVVKKLPDVLIPLAYSKDGIEMFKHKDKLIYATQFHPEMYLEKTCGDEIFNNFVKMIELY
jgi:GMP synthase-like glutamine amidotransferase